MEFVKTTRLSKQNIFWSGDEMIVQHLNELKFVKTTLLPKQDLFYFLDNGTENRTESYCSFESLEEIENNAELQQYNSDFFEMEDKDDEESYINLEDLDNIGDSEMYVGLQSWNSEDLDSIGDSEMIVGLQSRNSEGFGSIGGSEIIDKFQSWNSERFVTREHNEKRDKLQSHNSGGDGDSHLDPFLRSWRVKYIKDLIRSGKLPEQNTLDEMCQLYGKRSKVMTIVCEAVCFHIKSMHDAIVHVWAAYTLQNPHRITFIVMIKQNKANEIDTAPLRLDKLINYSFVKRYLDEYSLESNDIVLQQVPSEQYDERIYETLQMCILKHSEHLMKRHKHLSIISACPFRSKGFDSSRKLVPESCIVLYVRIKNYIPIDEEPFEKQYDGIPVDVREGAFIPFGQTAIEKMDAVKMGCQIRGDFCEGSYFEGTLGCFIDHPQFGICGLTCAHILLSPKELNRLKTSQNGTLKWPLGDMCKNVYQPANEDSSTKIGHAVHFIYKEGSSESSGMELALFKMTSRLPKSASFPEISVPESNVSSSIDYNNWRICSTDRLKRTEDHVIKFGSKTEFRDGTIIFDTTSVKQLDNYPLKHGEETIKLYKQMEVKSRTPDLQFASTGDSGSLVFVVDNNSQHTCIGIVEGGTTYGTVVVTPIVPILEELNVPCLKSFESEAYLSNINDRIENLESHVQKLYNGVQSMHGDMQIMKGKIQTVCCDICNLDTTYQKLDGRVHEICKNIQDIAHFIQNNTVSGPTNN